MPGSLLKRFFLFLRGLATTSVGAAGVVITTVAFVMFVVIELLQVLGVVDNAYIGLVSYLALPALFVFGLFLIPIGWLVFSRRTGYRLRDLLSQRFSEDWLDAPRLRGSRLWLWIAGLTIVNLGFLGVGTTRMLRFMDEPRFCGTACHAVMGPEWAAYQDSPHARVKCVSCHVGEGAGALVDAKINGLKQVYSFALDRYPQPVPTPVRQLRAAEEICARCHWSGKQHGPRVRTITHFADDRSSTPRYNTLVLDVGSGRAGAAHGIHWHAAPDTQIRYASVHGKRLEVAWVEVTTADGRLRRFDRRGFRGDRGELVERSMDCFDCHNRVAHVFRDPGAVVDGLLASGAIARSLPFARRAAYGALTGSYANREAADRGVAADFRGFYAERPELAALAVDPRTDRAIDALVASHRRNVHYAMRVHWNTYPDHRGHRTQAGCFRCHDADLVDGDGRSLSHGCTDCHQILALDSPTPYQFVLAPPAEGVERAIHDYLHRAEADSRALEASE